MLCHKMLCQVIDLIRPIRMSEHMELLGADYCEHDIYHPGVGVTRAVSVLKHVPKFSDEVNTTIKPVGKNYGKTFPCAHHSKPMIYYKEA